MERYQQSFKMLLHGKGKFPFFRTRAKLSWDWKEVRKIHPAMKPENLYENVLRPALNGDKKEARCLKFSGNTWVLTKALGKDNAGVIFEALEKKELEREEKVKETLNKFSKKETPEPEPATA